MHIMYMHLHVCVAGGLETERLLERVNQLYYDRLFQDRKSQQQEVEESQAPAPKRGSSACAPLSQRQKQCHTMVKSGVLKYKETIQDGAADTSVHDVFGDDRAQLNSNSSFEDIRFVKCCFISVLWLH